MSTRGLYCAAAAACLLAVALIYAADPKPAYVKPAFDAANYKGEPFKEPQAIPGRMLFAYFDKGGEGVAHHNYETKNEGSGALNNGPDPKNHFREKDGISTSYTKAAWDKFKDGKILPLDQFYVGWTFPGQWLNYTVDVKEAGTYTMNALLSCNGKTSTLSIDVDGVDKTGEMKIPTTGYYHTWQQLDNMGEITLPAGKHVLTVNVHNEGGMNLGHVDFVPKDAKAPASAPAK